jgi:putative oxidoreductase
MNGPVPSSWSPNLLSLVRIVAAFGLITHGTQKLFGLPTVDPRVGVELMSRAGLAGTIETCGGALLLVGLFTRPVAFLCAGVMASAYFIAHAPRNFWPILNGGELAAAYCFLFLYLAATGGGPLSIDAMMRGSSRRG